jgi:hypothetical protein
MFQEVPVWLQAFIAFCGTLGTISAILNNWWTYRLKNKALDNERAIAELHDCLDQHIAESRELHIATQEKVTTAAIVDDARDIRNAGTAAIISGEHAPGGHDAR